jgi:hypothetical protein
MARVIRRAGRGRRRDQPVAKAAPPRLPARIRLAHPAGGYERRGAVAGSALVAFVSLYGTSYPPGTIVASSNEVTSYLRIIP